jgi:plastocyanin
MRSRRLLVAAGTGLLLATSARAGVVGGTLWMSHGALAAHRTRGTEPDARSQPGVTDGVIWIESLSPEVDGKLANPRHWFWQKHETARLPRVVQMGRAFVPRVLSVSVGTRAEFQNLDHVYHNVFSVSSARRFDLGKNAPGRVDTVAFTRTGVVNLHCDIHPDELGYVVVTPNHAIARPDSLGRFRFPRLPPGRYTLHVFHPRRGELRRPIELARRGDLDVDLEF